MQRAWHEERLACSGISKGLALSGTHLRVSICQWHPSWCPAFLSPSSSLLCHKIPRFPSVHRFTHFTSLVKLLNDIFFFIHIPCEHPLSWGFYFPFVFNLVTYCSCINNHPQWISQPHLKPKTCFSTGLFHLRTWQPWSSSAQAKILSCPESLFFSYTEYPLYQANSVWLTLKIWPESNHICHHQSNPMHHHLWPGLLWQAAP